MREQQCMKSVKHYSFDLWCTLIKSNPHFKKERAMYFYQYYNSKNKSLLEVESAFRKIDLMCNSINQKTGGNIGAEEMYLMVVYEINNDDSLYPDIDTELLYCDMEKIFFKYPPTTYDSDTIDALNKIRQESDASMNILSNTAFIKGSSLRTILDNLRIDKYFDFQIYSDEVNLSKPNPEIFKKMINLVFSLRNNLRIDLNEIIHVGDNAVADIYGAQTAGIRAVQINTNANTIKNVFQ